MDKVIQTGSQSLLSMFAPFIAFSAISTILWAAIRIVQNDKKRTKYKPIPGPKGKFRDIILVIYH